jgi:hypothetical protein
MPSILVFPCVVLDPAPWIPPEELQTSNCLQAFPFDLNPVIVLRESVYSVMTQRT